MRLCGISHNVSKYFLYNGFENYTLKIAATSPIRQWVNERSFGPKFGCHSGDLFLNECINKDVGLSIQQWCWRPPHDDVIKWTHFARYWPFVRGIHRSPVNSPHKGQWRWALMFSLICVWINSWVNNREAGDLRRHRAFYGVIVMTNKASYCPWYILQGSQYGNHPCYLFIEMLMQNDKSIAWSIQIVLNVMLFILCRCTECGCNW